MADGEALGEILDQLATAEVGFEYMYAFAEGEIANVVVRPTNIERCQEALRHVVIDDFSNNNKIGASIST